ncbi:MAG: efflux RND transporter periplasmic adaptor subunit [Rubricoccaceae bacterium]
MTPTRKILIGTALLAAGVVAAVAVFGRGGERGVEVETAEARVRAITQTVTATGQIQPDVLVTISSEVSGEVVFLGVQEGDMVRQGQLLLRVRADVYASQQEQAAAAVAAAQTDVAQAQAEAARAAAERENAARTLARQQELYERDVAARAELDAARAALEVARTAEQAAAARVRGAQSRVASAQAQARQAAQQLSLTAIYAPVSGTVVELNVEPGERIVGTAQMAGTALMKIAQLDEMVIEVDVNETDVVRIQPGDSARVEVDAFPETPFRARVERVAQAARVQNAGTPQAATNFSVRLRILGADGGGPTLAARMPGETVPDVPVVLRTGMSGTVDVFTRTVASAVVVPLQAVTARDVNAVAREERRRARARGERVPETDDDIPEEEDVRRVVFVVEDGRAVMRVVRTGISDDTHVEIREGLAGGETVVTGPFALLRADLMPGDAVRVREPSAARRP